DKAPRIERFHRATVHSLLDMLCAMGLTHPSEIRPHHVFRRVDDLRVRHFGEVYDYLRRDQLIEDDAVPEDLRSQWHAASADTWRMKTGEEAGIHGGQSLRTDAGRGAA
ncbi:MAG: hypothetical protein DWQ08_01555, partial [Proteobacteria bacterium]